MKSNNTFTQKLVEKLKKNPIEYEEFLNILSQSNEKFFDNPELEFELLLSNGFPLDIDDEKIILKTANTLIKDQIFCVVDIETNGGKINKGHQIIEIGAVKYKNGQIIDKYESLVYSSTIPEYIQSVTNITPKMLENAPVLEKVLKEFKLFLDDDVFVAHDIKFDYNFISSSMEKYSLGKLENRKLCTIDLAKRTIKANRYGLKFLKEDLNINIDNHHRAYSDALSATYILNESIKSLDSDIKTVEDLIDFSKNGKLIIPKIKISENIENKKDSE